MAKRLDVIKKAREEAAAREAERVDRLVGRVAVKMLRTLAEAGEYEQQVLERVNSIRAERSNQQ